MRQIKINFIYFLLPFLAIKTFNSQNNISKAIAIIRGNTDGFPISGSVQFSEPSQNELLEVTVRISGLPRAGAKHGFHVHEKGISSLSDNISIACGSAGPHYNPLNMTHGDLLANIRHIGDYGNLETDSNGNILTTFFDDLSHIYGPFGILGRTIILHELEDDLGLTSNPESKLTGNSGKRIACGVIGVN